jgi:hypothetical protein
VSTKLFNEKLMKKEKTKTSKVGGETTLTTTLKVG